MSDKAKKRAASSKPDAVVLPGVMESPAVWDVSKDREQLDPDIVKVAIYANVGNLSAAARQLHVHRRTLYNYMERHPDVAQAYDDAKEIRIDYVEDKFLQRVNAGREIPMIFFLKTQAKHRGYVERAELTGRNGEPVTFNVVWTMQNLTTQGDAQPMKQINAIVEGEFKEKSDATE